MSTKRELWLIAFAILAGLASLLLFPSRPSGAEPEGEKALLLSLNQIILVSAATWLASMALYLIWRHRRGDD